MYIARSSDQRWWNRALAVMWIALGEHKTIAALLLVSIIGAQFFFLKPGTASAATYTWTQTAWTGGLDGGTLPNHTSNQSGWTKYNSASSTIATTTSLTLITSNGTTTQTTDTDFNAGTYTNQTIINGSGSTAGVKLVVSSPIAAGTWDTLAPITSQGWYGAASVYIPGSGDYMYSMVGNSSTNFYQFSVATNAWTSMTATPGAVYTGGAMVYPGSGDYIYATRGNATTDFYRYSISGNSWTSMAAVPALTGSGAALVYPGSGDYIYALRGNNSTTFYRYSISGDSWTSMTSAPGGMYDGAALAYPGSGDYIYATRGNATTDFYRYSISGNSWTSMTVVPAVVWEGGFLVYPGTGDYLYATVGNNTTSLYKYSISGNSWSSAPAAPRSVYTGGHLITAPSTDYFYLLPGNAGTELFRYSLSQGVWNSPASLPNTLGNGAALVSTLGDYVYAFRGSATNFYRYSVSGNSWTSMTSIPSSVSTGGALVYPASGDYVYAFRGNSTQDFYRYSISGNSWANMASTSGTVQTGAGLIYPASGDYIYALRGNSTQDFYRYSISGNSWSNMASTSAAIGAGAALSYPGSGDYIYALRGGSSNSFYRYSISGNTWSSMSSNFAAATGGSLVYPASGDYIYAFRGNTTKDFYRYSISGNSWAALASTSGTLSTGSALVYPGSGNYLYGLISSGIGGTLNYFSRYALSGTTLTSPGTFTSSAIDLGQNSTPLTFSYSSTSPAGAVTSISFQLRSASTQGGLSSATYYGPTGTGDTYTSSTSTVNAVHSGDRYIQYVATLNTNNANITPVLEDITLAYRYYTATSTLVSSAFNSQSSANLIAKIAWSESLVAGSDIKFQIRSAPDAAGSPGTYTGWKGPDGTANTYFTDPNGGDALPAALADGTNDQWMQYQVFLTSTGSGNPTLNDVTMTYVANSAPDFNPDYPSVSSGGVSATQGSNGLVSIDYSVRDTDTSSGSVHPGFITPSFEYSLDNGSTWTSISNLTLVAADYANKAVDQVTYTHYSATWTATSSFTGTYDTDAKIRVVADDGEAANHIASSTSAALTLDTKIPASTSVHVDASQSPALVTLSATDDSSMQMRVGTMPDLSDASWETYATSKNLSMTDGQTVYAQFRDAYSNTSAIISATPPSTPAHMYFTDISNPASPSYGEFIAWDVIANPSPGFAQYNIYRSVDGAAFSLVSTQNSRLTNYYADLSLSSASTYAYKVSSQDNAGNISFLSATTPADIPDGTGGSATSLPVISSVSSGSVTPTTAIITWTTNELADSKVYYKASATFPGITTGDYTNSASVPSMVTSHSVTLSGLAPNTQYFFLVQSTDPLSQASTSADVLYTFTTPFGASISNVTTAQVRDTGATVTWNTDAGADSTVTYSTSTAFTYSLATTSATAEMNHSLGITGLTNATTYYYYVSSVSGGNTSVDKNIVNGLPQYYSFHTSNDATAPVISGVGEALVGDTGATIIWDTDEGATSQIEWGSTTGLGAFTTETSTFSQSHGVTLTGLTANTPYYFRVISRDQAGNSASDDNAGSKYTFTTSVTATTTTVTVTNTVYVGGGGGGGGTVDNRDLTKPAISDVRVNAVSGDSAYISFVTSKIANGTVDYGSTVSYGKNKGDLDQYSVSHAVTLVDLTPETTYHFKAHAADVYKNSAESADFTFTTLEAGASVHAAATTDATSTPATRRQQLFSLLDNVVSAISGTDISEEALTSSLQELVARAVSAPVVSGTDITVSVAAKTATIRWTTDKSSNSIISYASASEFNSESEKPYVISAGSTDERVTKHMVVLDNLDPHTTYHFQVRSESPIGLSTLSKDATFTTLSLVPDITDARFESVGEDAAIAHWATGVPTRTLVELVNTQTGAVKKSEVPSYFTEHSYVVQGLDFSTPYTLRLTAIDADGNKSHSLTLPFTTVLSSEAPTISDVRISTTLVPGRIETAQTIIAWKTDKPATSRVVFVQGSGTEFKQLGTPDMSLMRDHVVISTLLKPGTVYKLRVESGSSGGASAQSQSYTILTAKPNASVVDLIFSGLDQTFGFLKR